jgi:hypothetical protein
MYPESTRQFFSPRQEWHTPVVCFLSVPPERQIIIQGPVENFVGVRLHWCDKSSRLCKQPEPCYWCEGGEEAREVFYAGVFLYSDSLNRFHPYLLGIGDGLDSLAGYDLSKTAFNVEATIGEDGRKDGLLFTKLEVNPSRFREFYSFPKIDVRRRLQKRFGIAS